MARPEPNVPERITEAADRTFTPRAVRWIVGMGIVSLVATLLLSVLASGREPTRQTADANAFSVSALGHRAFVQLLARLGVEVEVSRHRSAEKASAERPLLLLEPADSYGEAEHLAALVEHARDKPVLVAMPKWDVVERGNGDRWANRIELVSAYDVDRAIGAIDEGLEAGLGGGRRLEGLTIERGPRTSGNVFLEGRPTGLTVALEQVQYFTYEYALEPIVTVDGVEDATRVLVGRVRGTSVYLLSDPDILNTMGIGMADHAPLAVALVRDVLHAGHVVVDEVHHGFERVQTLWEELFGFPLVLVTLHVAGLLALTLWAAMARFGKPEPRPPRVPSGKQTLLDNTATLLALGHHAGYGVKRYFETTLRALARTYGIPAETADAARLAQLATIAAHRGHKTDVQVLAREVAALADRSSAREGHRARELARRIYAFRKELTDGHRSDS